jgi:RND family efflux transporter MFP subunit
VTPLYKVALTLAVAGTAGAVPLLALGARDVRAVRVARGAVALEAAGTGAIESRRTVAIGFEVTGRIARVRVDQGDRVKAGDEIASLDDEAFRADADVAAEDARLAEAALARLGAEEARGEAVRAGAEAHVARVRALFAKGMSSQEELEGAEERLKVALADRASAEAARLEGERRLASARRVLERARAVLARTVARAPFDGVILRREREGGDVAVPGAAVVRLADAGDLWASAWVDETFLDRLKPDLPARVVLRSAPDRPLEGRVARIGREVDRETRELLVDVRVDGLPDRIALGQRADVRIEVGRVDGVLRVPADALAHEDGRAGAFVLDDGRARFRPIELGARGRDAVEALRGLNAGEEVLVSADGSPLADGERVNVAADEPR